MSISEAFTDIRVDRKGAVSIIQICRPNVRNALRWHTLDEAHAAVKSEIAAGARAIVFTGQGEHAFSAGADLKDMSTFSNERKAEMQRKGWRPFFATLESSPVPVIAAIRGYALGGGLELALACHMRFVGASAKLGLPEILRGHIPGAGGTVRLPRLIGTGLGLQHLLLGDFIHADEAYRIGLANDVFPDAEVLDRSVEVAERFAKNSPNAVRLILRSVMGSRDMPFGDAIEHEIAQSVEMRNASDYASGWSEFVGANIKK
jgi:enoyl-CoA hydratase